MARALKILQSPDPLMWYAELVGEHVPLLRVERDYYISLEPGGFSNIVRKADAEVVDVLPPESTPFVPVQQQGGA